MKPPQPCSSGNTCKASHHGERHTRRTGQTEQARRSPGRPVTGCGMSLELDLKFDVLLIADIQNPQLGRASGGLESLFQRLRADHANAIDESDGVSHCPPYPRGETVLIASRSSGSREGRTGHESAPLGSTLREREPTARGQRSLDSMNGWAGTILVEHQRPATGLA